LSEDVTKRQLDTGTNFVDEEDSPIPYDGPKEKETNSLLIKNWSAIKSYALVRRYTKIYNIRVENNNISDTIGGNNMLKLYQDQKMKFKVNASLGFILINNTEQKLRYYHASANKDRLLNKPVLIETLADFREFIDQLTDKDFIEYATQNRPDTSWSIHMITNIAFYVYPIYNHPIGCPVLLPDYIKNNKAIVSADIDTNGRLYADKLCIFRALCLMRNKHSLESSTRDCFRKYVDSKQISEDQFQGVTVDDLPSIERLFTISINVYCLEKAACETIAKLHYRSSSNFKEHLNLHLYENHFSWIKNIRLYTKSYKCEYCSKLMNSANVIKRHSLSCSSATKFVYPSGIATTSKTIFEKLNEYGIKTDESRKHYPFFAVWDCEAYFDKTELPNKTQTIEWTAKHRLASISIASNVAGFTEPVCFVNETNSEYNVVHQMMIYLEKLSDLCYQRLKLRYKSIFIQIEQKRNELITLEEQAGDNASVEQLEKTFDKLEEELDSYISDMLVFGFNSGSYDIPLIKKHLFKYLLDQNHSIDFVIKKANSYMCIKTKRLRFLDIVNYLAPGFSYGEYLKAMEVNSKKFFWIYEKFTSMEMLKQTDFPSREDFYSDLKKETISLEDYNYCRKIWVENNMKTLKDLLIYYNNADCTGFVKALQKQNESLRTKNLDFKMAFSMPGLAIKRLFDLKQKNAQLFLYGEKDKDLYNLVKQNIRGGMSIIFHRYQHSETTKIKSKYYGEDAKTTKVCLGVDISGMYLSNLMRDMPTGIYVRRRRENEFKLEKRYTHGQLATEWIKCKEKEMQVEFQHMFNGVEKRVGGKNIPVDGYADTPNGPVVLQFSGCYFHSHMCDYSPNGRFTDRVKDLENQLRTYKNLKYLEDIGYTVHHSWECEFLELKSRNPLLKKFCEELNYMVDKRYKLTEDQILAEVKSEKLFGMVECDIETTDELKNAFAEFQPIPKHAYMQRKDVGHHMAQFAVENGLLKSPQKTLLNSYFGHKMLFATPLLAWYLNHGLRVTKVYQVIQYNPTKCFEAFGMEVMQARREGDVDPSKKLMSDSSKLMG